MKKMRKIRSKKKINFKVQELLEILTESLEIEKCISKNLMKRNLKKKNKFLRKKILLKDLDLKILILIQKQILKMIMMKIEVKMRRMNQMKIMLDI